MQAIKNKYAYVLKSIKKDHTLIPSVKDLTGKTYIISGATRGIGFNIAQKLALNGANVTIVGKTTEPHPKLEGTIYSAENFINNITQKDTCLGVPCDIRKSNNIDNAIEKTMDRFGSLDGVILNASALCLNNTLQQTEKEVDLMTSVNINGTYKFGQKCLQKMYKNNSPGHMIIIAPPIDMLYEDDWWTNHFYYTMSKFNMSLMAKFWNKEFKDIGVNTLWPRTTINTAPVRNILGGEDMIKISRKADIMGDAAYYILRADPNVCNGKNYIDDEVLASLDIDTENYRVDPYAKEKDLMPDFFC